MHLETKEHSIQGRKIWSSSDFGPIVHGSIVVGLWFLLQMFGIPPTFLTLTVSY
jgi:hypothetical protein